MKAPLIVISPEPIKTESLLAHTNDPGCGAQVIFLGVVRNRNDGRDVLAERV